MSTITTLTAVHRAGQTFLTWDKNGITGPFSVYRHTAQITGGTIGAATLIATVDEDSWHLLHDDSATANLTGGFVIEDEGTPLTSDDALLVWTTAVSGTFYYAVIHGGDSTVSVGTNSLTSGVVETHQTLTGWVRLSGPVDSVGRNRYRYFCWEDYSTWESSWGYYGNRVDVISKSGMTNGVLYPVWYVSHPADSSGYQDPTPWDYIPPGFVLNTNTCDGTYILARDNNFSGVADPYTGTVRNTTFDLGNLRANNRVATNTSDRFRRYIQRVLAAPEFQADTNRVYCMGMSRGGVTSHFAHRNSDIVTAYSVSVAWLNFAFGLSGRLMDDDTPYDDQADIVWNVENLGPLPGIYQFGSDDPVLTDEEVPDLITALQTTKTAHVVVWTPTGHGTKFLGQFNHSGVPPAMPQADVARFRKDEAYPCFTGSSLDDDLPTVVAGLDLDPPSGQFNQYLDWHSSLHSITGGSAIVDTADEFSVSLISLDVAGTAGVTIRNQQSFLPDEETEVNWSDGTSSGTVTPNVDGSITIPGVTIGTSATRLTLESAAVQQMIPARVWRRGVRI